MTAHPHDSHDHAHAHAHAGHTHDHHDHDHQGHGHGHDGPVSWLRAAVGAVLVLAAAASACLLQVHSGEAVVITRFGDPVRILRDPGPDWKLPLPLEAAASVDLRLRTTSSGLQDVGTKDGLRIIVNAYVGWKVQPDDRDIRLFMRSVRNEPDQAASQIRSFVGSALETAASGFDLSSLINTDASKLQLDRFENRVREQIEGQLRETYGVSVVQVGIESVTLPDVTLTATIDRMRAERETIAVERTAAGKQQAAEIRSAAERDARILQADATVKAAGIEAAAISEAASIYGKAHASAPQLYELLRSLDTLGAVIGSKTRLILRTDAAPFRVLSDGPPAVVPKDAAPVGETR